MISMKRFFTLLLILGIGRMFSQTVIYGDDFSAPTVSVTGDWIWDNAGFYPNCNVSGSSGAEKYVGQQANSATLEEIGNMTAINTSTFVNITVSWNMIRGTALTPSLTFQWSNDAGASWNTATYSVPSGTVWGAVPSVSLPAAASGTLIYVRWSYTSVGGFNDYVGIDDIKVSGIPSPSYYWNGSGALTNVTSWGTNTNGTGANPPDFTTANQNFYLVNAATTTLAGAWTIGGSNSVLNIGDGSSGNKIKFTIPSGFALTMSGGAKLNVTNSSTLTLLNTTFPAASSMMLGTSSTVEFGQSATVSLWATTYGNLILSGTSNRNQSTGSTVVMGEFILGSGINYVMVNSPASITQLSGKVTCSGTVATGVSNLTIDGSSANTIGTINFSGSGLNNLVLNRSSQTLTLGSNLTCSGVLAQTTQFTNGSLSLNGKLITLNGPVTFHASSSNGVITGSSTSSMTIGGSGTITNGLVMDQASSAARTLNNFSINRSSTTLSLGNELTVNTFSQTNGNIDLAGQALTLNNAITFPTSSSNGMFIGSTTSSLSITGSGAIANSLFMDQTSSGSRSLGMFTNTRGSSTVVMGNNLIVSGPYIPTNGMLDINGNLLTLSGIMTLPSNPSNRGFIGSSTSSITINGSGAITNSFFMVQTNANTRQLSVLTLNRSGETLTLGNTLETYGEILPTAGILATGGNLFIRSDATNKGRIGTVGGSVTGNVKVETFALGGTTGWTNLGVSGISGQQLSNWDNQIPMTCNGCTYGPTDAGGYFVSVQGWDETAAASSTLAYIEKSSTSPLTPGVGFWVYLGDNVSTTGNITWTVSGSAVQGNQSLPLTNSGASNGDGFNLIANPYPSPVLWSAISSSSVNPTFNSFMDDAIYVYNPDAGGNTQYVGGVQSDPVNGIGNNIPMGQGFYVQQTAGTNFNLAITEACKVKSNAPLLREANTTDIGAVIRLKVEKGAKYDYTAIRFHGDATTGWDKKLDAHKLFKSPASNGANDNNLTISTQSEGSDYGINSLPLAINNDAVIPVLVRVQAAGQHTITGSDLQNLPNSCIELKDKLTGALHNLKSGPYVCSMSMSDNNAPRFELRVCADVAMSVSNEQKNNIDQSILIKNDENGVYVQYDFDAAKKSTISVTNILGQKIVDNKTLSATKDKVYLDIPEKHQIVFVTVTTDHQKVTKKIVR